MLLANLIYILSLYVSICVIDCWYLEICIKQCIKFIKTMNSEHSLKEKMKWKEISIYCNYVLIVLIKLINGRKEMFVCITPVRLYKCPRKETCRSAWLGSNYISKYRYKETQKICISDYLFVENLFANGYPNIILSLILNNCYAVLILQPKNQFGIEMNNIKRNQWSNETNFVWKTNTKLARLKFDE